MDTLKTLDTADLEARVKSMYREVAEEPDKDFHFETGRGLAERLGYSVDELDRVPGEAIESFAGVGCYFDLVEMSSGETVLDLGSGSGTDAFVAALRVGERGSVIGVDMTNAQLEKAARLAREGRFANVEFREGYIEEPPVENASVDLVISNGVINLSADKSKVFAGAARALRDGGRLAIADIVTETNCRRRSPATRRSGPPVSAGRCNASRIGKRSRLLASRSRPFERTPGTGSCPTRRKTRPRSTE